MHNVIHHCLLARFIARRGRACEREISLVISRRRHKIGLMGTTTQARVWLAGNFALLLGAAGAVGQGTFQNLGFESATVTPGPPYSLDFSQAFPGWTGSLEGDDQFIVVYNALTMDGPGFGIVDRSFSNPYYLPGGLIQGNFTAVVMSGQNLSRPPADATLAQTGVVPTGTQSLLFRAQMDNPGSSETFSVTLGGQTLSLIPLQAGPNYTLYGADIHTWAGQTAELAFTAIAQRPHHSATWLYLDAIEFSSLPIPEPSLFRLSGLGALLLGWHVLGRQRPRTGGRPE